MVGPPPASWRVAPDRARAFELAEGIWQLRLPLPWPLIPHVNAYVLDGEVLVDCGSAGHPTYREALSEALVLAGTSVSAIRTLVVTHVHSDHVGLAEWVVEQSGCDVRMHPDTAHFYDAMRDPARIEAARQRRAWQEGVPEAELPYFGDTREETVGALAPVDPDRPLRDGDRVGAWEVLETPGHAPSHISLVDRSRGAIILGDLLAPVFAPWYDYGYSPDPVAEFLGSIDRVAGLGPLSLAMPGHGRVLEDLPAIIADHRRGVAERLEATLAAVRADLGGAHAITERVFGPLPPIAMVWRMTEVACYLRHLRLAGAVMREVQSDGRFRYAVSAQPFVANQSLG